MTTKAVSKCMLRQNFGGLLNVLVSKNLINELRVMGSASFVASIIFLESDCVLGTAKIDIFHIFHPNRFIISKKKHDMPPKA